MKTITIVVPTYKEELNVIPAYEAITRVMTEQCPEYHYEIQFVDNDSPDGTRELIKQLCQRDSEHVKAIFNARNFGQCRSHFYGLTQAAGDCAILLHADLQNPPEVMVKFIREWENGAKVVIGIKDNSKENKIMFFLRSCYYKIMHSISDVEQIEHFSDFELLDRDFLNVLRGLHEPMPYLRGIVSELGFRMVRVHYSQNRRERGKTTANFGVLYDFAMAGFTSYTKSIMRLATILGVISSGVSLIIAIITIVQKIVNWDSYQTGIATATVGIFLLGSIQLFFIGLLGEYILSINTRVMDRPLVVEEQRINFNQQVGQRVSRER